MLAAGGFVVGAALGRVSGHVGLNDVTVAAVLILVVAALYFVSAPRHS
jgi:hypothetical protein